MKINKTNKCICKKLDQGFINLKCPVHVGLPKVDKKWLLSKTNKEI